METIVKHNYLDSSSGGMESFDWRTYLLNYPELQPLHIDSRKKAYHHWLTYGKEEGKIDKKKDTFSWETYVENYPELEITTQKIAWDNWKYHGVLLGRTDKKIDSFNWENYIKNYPELQLESKEKAWEHWKYHGLREGRTDVLIHTTNQIVPKIDVKIYLVTSFAIESIAFHFKSLLQQLVSAKIEVIYSLTKEMCERSKDQELFIIIHCDHKRLTALPKLFVFYQIEQSLSDWFTPSYRMLLENSRFIWDFSIKNYELYSDQPLEKVHYMPMPLSLQPAHSCSSYDDCVYDIFFYGSKNERRQAILSKLAKRYNIYVGFGMVGKAKEKMIQQSKIIINLHYYEECALETCRLNEILPYNKLIISEKPSANDIDNFRLYQNSVVWTDEINGSIFDTIDYYLKRDNYLCKLEEIKKNKIILEQNIKQILYKNISNVLSYTSDIEVLEKPLEHFEQTILDIKNIYGRSLFISIHDLHPIEETVKHSEAIVQPLVEQLEVKVEPIIEAERLEVKVEPVETFAKSLEELTADLQKTEVISDIISDIFRQKNIIRDTMAELQQAIEKSVLDEFMKLDNSFACFANKLQLELLEVKKEIKKEICDLLEEVDKKPDLIVEEIDQALYLEYIRLPPIFKNVLFHEEITQDTFNWRMYIGNYKELQSLHINSRKKAYDHWINIGRSEGKTDKNISSLNWESYLENYPDLRNAGICTPEGAWNHWKKYGLQEGRTDKSILSFDWNIYLNNYPELKLAGINTRETAWDHWKNYGIKQGRTLKKNLIESNVCQTQSQYQSEAPLDHRVRVYVISNHTAGGGADKYLKDIKKKYDDVIFVNLQEDTQLRKITFRKKDIIFLQYLFGTDIKIDTILDIQKIYNCSLVISIHDFYWLKNKVLYDFDDSNSWQNGYLEENISICPTIKKLFNCANQILHPSRFTWSVFEKYFSTDHFKLVQHNDCLDYKIHKVISPIINKRINIGVLHYYNVYKGKDMIEKLRSKYNTYNGYTIHWVIVGINVPPYKENEFYEYISKYNINCLTFLNQWGETWCYSLTKAFHSGLPIIYNNFGAFRERIPENTEHYFKAYEDESEQDPQQLYNTFEKMIDYLICHDESTRRIVYNHYYDDLFFEKIAVVICNYSNRPFNIKLWDKPHPKHIHLFYLTDQSDVKLQHIQVIHHELSNIMFESAYWKEAYYKTHLHTMELFSNYNYIVYIETSVSLDINTISLQTKDMIKNNYELCIYKDSSSITLKDEYLRSCLLEKYRDEQILHQFREYTKYPPFILYQSNCFFYEVSPRMTKFMEKWWNEMKEYNSYHTTLSFSYILYANPVSHGMINHLIIDNEQKDKVININEKINGIDHIVWINLDRSPNRKKYMEGSLSPIRIPNTRISAIDGNSYDVEKYNNTFTKYEIACTLSHIKAIHQLKQLSGKYFMICEDDVAFNQSYLFRESLSDIIRDAPPFDILMIYKTWFDDLPDTYVKWINFYKKECFISGTVCYIISRSGVDKLSSLASYDPEKNNFDFKCPIDVADTMIYKNVNSYVYKYNYVSTLNEESTIHSNHLSAHKRSTAFQLYQIYNKLFNN